MFKKNPSKPKKGEINHHLPVGYNCLLEVVVDRGSTVKRSTTSTVYLL